jgi:branched-chain amino acid transport system permease protein
MSVVSSFLTRQRGNRAVRPVLLVVVLLLAAVTPFVLTDSSLAILVAILLTVIGAVAANLLIGVANQASVGNAALMAIGAFAAARVAAWLHLPVPLTVLIAGALAGAVGLIIAIPAARVRGLYLIIATLALHYIALYLLTRYQGSTVGIGGFSLDPVRLPGLTLDQGWFYIAFVVAAVAVLVMHNLLRSRYGRAWSALARDEVAARTLGVNLFRQKLAVFGLSAFLIGVQGALYGYYVGVVSSDQFTFDMAVSYVAMVVVGGLGTVAGSVLGAIFVSGLPYLVTAIADTLPASAVSALTTRLFAFETLLYGVAIVAFIVFEPRGLLDIWRRVVRRVTGARADLVTDEPTVAAKPAASAPVAESVPADSGGEAPVLAVAHLQVTYNRLSVAVDDISFSVGKGEIVVLLGANGAGKTTTLRGISGFLPAENAGVTWGRVTLSGQRVDHRLPFELARRGMMLVPERDKIFKTLTVAENLAVVPTRKGGDRAAMMDLVNETFPALLSLRGRQAGYLSGGERQMLAISKALVVDPTVLLVDELSLGIAPFLVARMVAALDDVRRRRQIGVLLVEQNAAAALAVADQACVLRTGRIVLRGTGAELLDNPEVRRLYLGGGERGRYGRLDTVSQAASQS